MADETLDLPEGDVVEPQREFAPGSTLGHFRITREVGAGGMGIVFEAYDPDLDRKVAIKILRDPRAHRLIAEAQAMARLAHPNVVAVHEVGTVDDQFFVVMELVTGGTLASWLAAPHGWRDIVRMFLQAGDGLVAAHDSGLVHGDFKPNNVLVDDAGRARVADFGLAHAEGDERPRLAAGSQPAGTPAYMAPEQVAGEHFDARADQYSFAIALRDALANHKVPRRITSAIERALSEDPEARFPTMRPLLAELRPVAGSGRRAIIAAVGLAGASAAVAAVLASSTAAAPDNCMAGVSLVDDVWTTGARAQLAAGHETTAKLLDDWTAAWRLGRRTACVAEPAQRPARVACLDGRLADLRAQLAVWQRGDALSRSLPAAASLPPPESCAAAPPAPPTSFPIVVGRIAMVNAFRRSGMAKTAQPMLDSLLADAEATGDRKLYASALYAAGSVDRDAGAQARATDEFNRAAREAADLRDTAFLLDVMASQAEVALDRGKPLEALGTLDAIASMTGLAAEEPRAKAQIALGRSDALTMAGRYPEATVEAKKALAILEPLAERDRGMRPRLAGALGALAAAEGLAMHFEDARALLERCLAMEEADYGADNPEIAKTLHDLANMEARLQKFAIAREHYLRARKILATAYGDNHQLVALSDYSLGGFELQQNHDAAARPYFDRALAELAASVGLEHPDVANVEGAIGYIERDTDHCRDAIPHFEHAVKIAERAGISGSSLASHLTNLGACLADDGRDAEAKPALERAMALEITAGVPELDRSEINSILAEVAWRAGDRKHAIKLATAVVQITAGKDEPYLTLHTYMKKQLATWSH